MSHRILAFHLIIFPHNRIHFEIGIEYIEKISIIIIAIRIQELNGPLNS